MSRLENQLNSLPQKTPEHLEKFIENSKHIHGDHLLVGEVKYMLCLMYGNVTGYQYKGLPIKSSHTKFTTKSFSDLSERLLQRKTELCRNLIEIYDKIDPGETTQRMNILFELNCAIIVETRLKLLQNRVKRHEAQVLRMPHETRKTLISPIIFRPLSMNV